MRSTPLNRSTSLSPLVTLLMAALLAVAAASAARANPLPQGVPDVLAAEAARSWDVLQGGTVEGNSLFPLLMFVNRDAEQQPGAVLVALDTQEQPHAAPDRPPAILVALFSDPQTVTRIYYDAGSAETGRPSGVFAEVGDPALARLPELLRMITARTSAGGEPGHDEAVR